VIKKTEDNLKPSLVIMAAGMGSRYGGLKQMEAMGPHGAAILDYSIHDALRAGFGQVVFIIRKDLEKDFRRLVGKKWEKKAPVRYVFQELDLLPQGFQVPEGRQKPWGTGHAIWAARNVVREPFAAINADDFYGRGSFKVLGQFLKAPGKETTNGSKTPTFAMVGFPLSKTLSEHGTVARGVCVVGPGKQLRKVVERTQIGHEGRSIHYLDEKGKKHPLKGAQTVSMNMWGFTPHLFRLLDSEMVKFLKAKGNEPKSEFLIPRVVDQALAAKKIKVKVLPTKSEWFGVTYPEDKMKVQERLRKMSAQKVYPARPWA
jgi:NDP-sugar pyrophosphorylase family protein